jgi:hypothetical protein
MNVKKGYFKTNSFLIVNVKKQTAINQMMSCILCLILSITTPCDKENGKDIPMQGSP